MHTIKIKENHYKVIAEVEAYPGMKLPLADIPMMSDETWNEIAGSSANLALLNRHCEKQN